MYDRAPEGGQGCGGRPGIHRSMSISYILGVVAGIIASALVTISLNMPFLGAAIIAIVCAALVWRSLEENFGMETIALRTILAECLRYYRKHVSLQMLTVAETCRYTSGTIYLFLYQPYLVTIGLGRTCWAYISPSSCSAAPPGRSLHLEYRRR